MEGLHCESCQFEGVESKAHKEAESLEERTLPSEAWSNSDKATGAVHSTEVVVEDSPISAPFSEPLLGFILKMPASLQPVCIGGSPVMVPVEMQLAGGVEPHTPVITPTPGCLSLPLIYDQPPTQYISPLSSCPISEHQNLSHSRQQNSGLSQDSSLPVGQSQNGEGKSNISENSSGFFPASQELFPFLRNYSSAALQGSFPLSTGFIPPDTTLSHVYTGSPLVSLIPPATLLVPFPLVVPLPVPLPIPIPIPPFPDAGSLCRSCHTMKTSTSTQTMTEDIPVCAHNRMSGYGLLQPPPPVSQEEVLDLTVKVLPIQTKQEVQFSLSQDDVLDLSVGNKSCLETGKNTKLQHHGRNSTNEESTKLILPMTRSQTQATHQSHGYSDVEFSMHYKWTTEKCLENYSGQNGRVITPKHMPRVTRSTRDTSVILREELVRPQQQQVLKNRVVKQKREYELSRNINIPPIKKQQMMTFFPNK